MRFFDSTVKLGSLRPWTAVLTLAAVGVMSGVTAGCVIVSGDDSNGGGPPPDTSPPALDTPVEVGLDTNMTVDAQPGDGVGMFVEYAEGGHWRLWTTCDTNTSHTTCSFEAYVS